MEFEAIRDYNAAYQVVGEKLKTNPHLQSSTVRAHASAEALTEADRIFTDFFKAENSEVFGDIIVYAGTDSESNYELTRTLRVDEATVLKLSYAVSNENGSVEESYDIAIDPDSTEAAKILEGEIGNQLYFSVGRLATIDEDPRYNVSQAQIQDSLETMRELHTFATNA